MKNGIFRALEEFSSDIKHIINLKVCESTALPSSMHDNQNVVYIKASPATIALTINQLSAVNATFGKVLCIATDNTLLHLISTKSMPILLYGLDVCLLNVASLDLVQTRLLMNVFKTSTNDIIQECCVMFDVKSISDTL